MPTTLFPTYEGDLCLTETQPFTLVSGVQLAEVKVRFAVYGTLNDWRDNAMLVCHALSGSARVGDWWPQLFGEAGLFDLARDCIICVNVLGSCYGSTGPRDVNPATGDIYGDAFPLVTVCDWVRAQAAVLDHLGIEKLRAVIGGSIGGMQALQWAVTFPERVEQCVAVGAAPLTALGLALNHLQRQAIYHDPLWQGGRYDETNPPKAGLSQARAIAMCSYKSEELFQERYGRLPNRNGEDPHQSLTERYDIGGYLDHQGEIFTRRFDAASYVILTKAMDNFDLAHGVESEQAALRRVQARTLLVGISSDWLFPATEVKALSERMRSAGVEVEYAELQSTHGHDGFLAEADALARLLRPRLQETAFHLCQTAAPGPVLSVCW
jgi:homoserine O-acetyltransferase